MSVIGTKRTYRVALHMSAVGRKRTSLFALQIPLMTASDIRVQSGGASGRVALGFAGDSAGLFEGRRFT